MFKNALAFCLFLALLIVSPLSYAQVSIAVVDVERVLNEVDAAKALSKTRASAREAFLKTLSVKEKALREEGKALFAKRNDLGEEEFLKQQKAYEAKLIEMRKMTQTQKRSFEDASNIALESLKDELEIAVQAIAEDKNYSLVISNRDVITGAASLDITDETMQAMNDKKIKIPFALK